jgi:hypothetical protein
MSLFSKKIRFGVTPDAAGATSKRTGQPDCALGRLYAAATDQAHQDHDDGNDQQDVDEAADGVGSDQAKQPQDDKDNSDCV